MNIGNYTPGGGALILSYAGRVVAYAAINSEPAACRMNEKGSRRQGISMIEPLRIKNMERAIFASLLYCSEGTRGRVG